jgi:putative transposase
MSRYRRANIEGGSYFFTVTLADRSSDLLTRHIEIFRGAYAASHALYPFTTVAICILPEHLHAVWTLPPADANFSLRWSLIKSKFSRALPFGTGRTASNITKREKGLWQRRYWEHAIRDENDLARHIDYIHFNPVKHGYVSRVCDWPHSSFSRYVAKGLLPADWGGDMKEITGKFGE